MYCSYLLRHKTVFLLLFSIVIPYDNEKDLDKIDPELRKKVNFYPVKDIKEVLTLAFPNTLERQTAKL